MNLKIKATTLALTLAFLGQSVFAMDLTEDSKPTSTMISLKNIYNSGGSIVEKYIPTNLNCGTFVGFKDNLIIDIDQREYSFCEGAVINPMGTATLKKDPVDILPTGSFTRVLPIEDIFLNMQDRSLVMIFKYKDASYLYSGYSYQYTVKTPIEFNDLENFHIQSIYNKYIPNESARNCFEDLKDGKVSEIEGSRYIFVKGKEIYADHEEEKTPAAEVLPAKLLLNSMRENHKLVNINPEFLAQNKNILYLSYRYEPSCWYRGLATHFEFTVATILDSADAEMLSTFTFLKVSLANEMANDLYRDIIDARSQGLLSTEDFTTFFFGTNDARLISIENIQKGNFSNKDICRQMNFWRSKLNMATSPLSLMLDGHERMTSTNIFKMQKSNPTLNVGMDSILKFND